MLRPTLTGLLACIALGCSSSGSGGAFDGGAGAGGGGGFAGVGGSAGQAGTGGGGAAGVAGSSGASAGHTVSGTVEILNPGAGSETSVILAPADFNPDVPALEPPAGPKATNVVGAWSIPNVPDGDYTVLVAWENDFLTLDPDPTVAGSGIEKITVQGQDVVLPSSFKVTGALDVSSPDNGETIAGAPIFVFQDDAGEVGYELSVFDAAGQVIWKKSDVPSVSGNPTVSVSYAGPPLASGALHQFRAVALKTGGFPISRTEDLRGVFRAQ